ncbi:MAG: type II toxin-antitoxin system VapC family toxin [Cyanobacteriota bacterium]
MSAYLLDTNICIYYFKGLYDLDKKIKEIGISNCSISEITIAELKFGVENSSSTKKEENRKMVESFINSINITPIVLSLDVYAREKSRLRKKGLVIDEFDLLIGSSAIANNLILVTKNIKHFENLDGIKIENWTE